MTQREKQIAMHLEKHKYHLQRYLVLSGLPAASIIERSELGKKIEDTYEKDQRVYTHAICEMLGKEITKKTTAEVNKMLESTGYFVMKQTERQPKETYQHTYIIV